MAGKGSPKGVKQGGRQKGTPNKVTAELKDMILEALDGAGGVAYLQKQATESPNAFLALIGKVLPLQLVGKNGGDIVIEVRRFSDGPVPPPA